jgi:hypothetical protein
MTYRQRDPRDVRKPLALIVALVVLLIALSTYAWYIGAWEQLFRE